MKKFVLNHPFILLCFCFLFFSSCGYKPGPPTLAPTPTPIPIATPTPIPTATPSPTPTPTPLPSPTPTPDPNAPTVENAKLKIMELETQGRLISNQIYELESKINLEFQAIQSDWNTLKRKHASALAEAENDASETRYKKNTNGVLVPYQYNKMGMRSRIASINNIFNQEKMYLENRNQVLQKKRDELEILKQQQNHNNAYIEHLKNWIRTNSL